MTSFFARAVWGSVIAVVVAGGVALWLYLQHDMQREVRHDPAPPRPAAPALRPETTTMIASAATEIEQVQCWFRIPDDHAARCIAVTVPERWSDPSSRRLRLRGVVLRRPAANPEGRREPIVYLSGGPGAPSGIDEESIGQWWAWIDREAWLADRDLVIFDQRGVGLSEPRMNCPEFADAAFRGYGRLLTLKENNALWSAAAARCHDRLTISGIDLGRYNTATMATDMTVILRGLGYRSWTLLGTSYGTRLALRLAAATTGETRAMVLDSVDPPDAKEYVESAHAAARVFARLSSDCSESAVCHSMLPDLRSAFERVVDRANANPLVVRIEDPQGEPRPVILDGARLIEVLLNSFYDPRQIEELPSVIAALDRGDLAPLRPLVQSAMEIYVAHGFSHGVFLSVECHDDYPFNPPEAVAQASLDVPLFRKYALSALTLAACPSWPSGTAPSDEPVGPEISVPTLMLSGDLDPVTGPERASVAASQLRYASDIRFPGIGHGVLNASECANEIVGSFLDDPMIEPAASCVLTLGVPRFHRGNGLARPG